MKIKGRSFIPKENSFSVDYRTDKEAKLAGTREVEPQITTIIEDIFEQREESFGQVSFEKFTLTRDDEGNIYKVLFDRGGLDIKRRLEEYQDFLKQKRWEDLGSIR